VAFVLASKLTLPRDEPAGGGAGSGVFLTIKLSHRPDQPVGGVARLWLDLVYQSPRRYERFLAIR
jgi:hypothetical protein